MPRQKDLKRLVRARMHKTGEAYTSARAHVLAKPRVKPRTASAVDTPVAHVSAPNPKEYAKLAGMSDAIIKEKTGCTWERWVKSLDYHGAAEMSHRDIATLIHAKYKTPSWWTQTVAVGYERIKGLRARGQPRDRACPLPAHLPTQQRHAVGAEFLRRAGTRLRTGSRPLQRHRADPVSARSAARGDW